MPYPRRGRARYVTRSRSRLILSGSKTLILSQATETDLAQVVRAQHPRNLTLTTEADSAFSVRPQRQLIVLQAEEVDTTTGLTTGIIPVNKTTETDSVLPFAAAGHLIHPGQATAETDTALAITRAHRKILGQSIETDIAQVCRPAKQRILGGTTSVNTAQHIKIGPVRVGQAAPETDSATHILVILAVAKHVAIGAATAEGDVTFKMCPSGGRNNRRVALTLFHE